MYSLVSGALIIFPQRIIFHFYWKNGLLTHLMISGICCLVIVILDKMTEKDIVNNLDAPLDINPVWIVSMNSTDFLKSGLSIMRLSI